VTSPWLFLCAAVLLSLERLCYAWIWRAPDTFRAWCTRPAVAAAGGPVDILQLIFCGFKALQLAVFLGWCYAHGRGEVFSLEGSAASIGLGGALLAAGQALNLSVFYRLGKAGVFYGNKFGYRVPWCRRFPFSWFRHPQYVGALLSIWGFFLVLRFPHDDWYWLPVLETAYYGLGAYLER
jgi:methylene-fatty-acyl-phospholipid synthase